MATRAERSPRFDRLKTEPGLLRNTLITVALLVLATVVGSVILGNQRFIAPWEDRQEFYATFAATPGISPGNGQEVRIHGVIVGDIVEAGIDADGYARVKLSVEGRYPVYENATLLLRPKSPLNEMYITMNPGSPPAERVVDGDVLPLSSSERPIQIDEVLSHLDDNAQRALTSLLSESDVALVNARTTLPAGLDATRMVANNLRPVSEELAERKELLRRLVTALGQISQSVGGDEQRVRALAASMQTTLRSLGGHSAQIDQSLAALPGVVDQLGRSTTEVRALSDELDPALRNLQEASEELPEALDSLRGTTDKLDEVVEVAGPFLDEAKPVLEDLRPLVDDLRTAVPELRASTKELDPISEALLPFLPDLAAFAIHTRSLVGTEGANSGILRGALDPGLLDNIPTVGGPNQGIKPVPAPLLDQGTTQVQDAVPTGPGGERAAPQDGSDREQPDQQTPEQDNARPLIPGLGGTG